MLEKTNRINMLFDFYQSLLTAKQKEYMEMYYLEDYSLSEISQVSGVSRQAVYDNIKRTEQILEDYEAKLRLYEKFQKRQMLMERIERIVKKKNEDHLITLIQQLKEMD